MALYTRLTPSMVIPGGKENGVASVQYYFQRLLEPDYKVFFDVQDEDAPVQRGYPCVIVDQVDFFPDITSFMGDKAGAGRGRRERLQMYFRSVSNIAEGGSKRQARRMRDQIFFCLSHLGVVNPKGELYFEPIKYLDFTTSPPTPTHVRINVDRGEGAMQDRFAPNMQYPHLVQYDLLARFFYITSEE